MGKASQAKKVNRAAATGGGRTAGRKAPVGWYSSLILVLVLGVTGVFIASKNLSDSQKQATVSPPTTKDHWHAAYGFNLCGKWADPLNDGPAGDRTGIHTHADGLVHVHPFTSSAAGKNATFGKLMDTTDTSVTATSVDLKREGQEFKNGDKCGKKPGVLTARVFKNLSDTTGKELKGDPSDWRIVDGSIISISFNPEGFEVTQPPSAAQVNDPGDLGPTEEAPPTEIPEAPAVTDTTAADVTPTTAQ